MSAADTETRDQKNQLSDAAERLMLAVIFGKPREIKIAERRVKNLRANVDPEDADLVWRTNVEFLLDHLRERFQADWEVAYRRTAPLPDYPQV
ncbi:MAG: hypothetical protein IT179_07905 [Acidobacteria bacterium]|nr:hypothetical protein [Acidobacteriota bacterium]